MWDNNFWNSIVKNFNSPMDNIICFQAADGVCRDICTVPFVAQAPAEFVAVALLDDAALACLPVATAVNVPLVDAGEFTAGLVFDTQITNDTLSHIGQTDVALGTLGLDGHQTRLRDTGIAIGAQFHLDIELVQLRTGKKTCC